LSLFWLIFYLRLSLTCLLSIRLKEQLVTNQSARFTTALKGDKGSRQSVPESLVDGAALQLIRWFENTHETKYLNPEKEPLYVSLEIKQFCMTKDN